ncbi:MAG: hypothetical protein AAF205_11285 [Pseudomonadota bacterium]
MTKCKFGLNLSIATAIAALLGMSPAMAHDSSVRVHVGQPTSGLAVTTPVAKRLPTPQPVFRPDTTPRFLVRAEPFAGTSLQFRDNTFDEVGYWSPSLHEFDDGNRAFAFGDDYRPGEGYFGPAFSDGWLTLDPLLKADPVARYWVIRQFDRNNNGRLSFKEARLAGEAFMLISDDDRDGYLTQNEKRAGIADLTAEYHELRAKAAG